MPARLGPPSPGRTRLEIMAVLLRSPSRCRRLFPSLATRPLVVRLQGAAALREPTEKVVPRRPALALDELAPAVRPPIFQGASRERDDVVAALDRMELPRERPSELIEELRRAEALLRLSEF